MDLEPGIDFQEWPQRQSTDSPSQWPSHPPSLETHDNRFNHISHIEPDIQYDRFAKLAIGKEVRSWGLEFYEPPLVQMPGAMQVQSSSQIICDYCHDPLQDTNSSLVHLWANHPSSAVWTPRNCLWVDCELDKTFKSHKSWLEHVYNVHLKSYKCKLSTCNIGTLFGSKNMAERHYTTAHGERIRCTKIGCQGRKHSNLSRKDKRRAHDTKWHGPLVCDVDGCPRGRIHGENQGFPKQADLDKHIRRVHRNRTVRNQTPELRRSRSDSGLPNDGPSTYLSPDFS
jgi:hypothetical protein